MNKLCVITALQIVNKIITMSMRLIIVTAKATCAHCLHNHLCSKKHHNSKQTIKITVMYFANHCVITTTTCGHQIKVVQKTHQPQMTSKEHTSMFQICTAHNKCNDYIIHKQHTHKLKRHYLCRSSHHNTSKYVQLN